MTVGDAPIEHVPAPDYSLPMYERVQHPEYPAMGWFRPTKHNWSEWVGEP